jgi:hypothetical protein
VKLLLDEMFSKAVAEGLRRRGVDAVAIQEIPALRGLPDHQVFVAAQLDKRVVVSENIADFVALETAWRAEQVSAHHGLVLVAPGSFPRHRRGAVGRLVLALEAFSSSGVWEEGSIAWLRPT